jgi:hypothetical protein
MVLEALMHDIRKLETEAVVVGLFEDVRPLTGGAGALDWLLCGALSRLVRERRIRGAQGEVALLTNAGKIPAPKIFLVGLGRRDGLTPDAAREAGRTAAASLGGAGITQAAVDLFPAGEVPGEEALLALRQGFRDGAAGHALAVALIAPDAPSFERMSRVLSS